jgi:uncharacterized protein YgbK (DUF1537 family)
MIPALTPKPTNVLLGCIADDFTGGTDLAAMLVKHGMRTVQMIGVPESPLPADIDAVVIALKSRTTPVADAVADSLGALRYLQAQGCRQFYFKYCSTFDSTPAGNIGQVAEALMDALGAPFTIACPAFPANARTIYRGYLFVGDVLLSESGMRDHPLTPMTDANLVRVLQPQVRRHVGLVPHAVVAQGPAAIARRFAELSADGIGIAIVDAIADADLAAIGEACADLPLVTGGSGAALGLPRNFERQGLLASGIEAARLPPVTGHRAVISGSCSVATNAQVAAMRERHPAFRVDANALARGGDVVMEAAQWAASRIAAGPVLIYATAPPGDVRQVQAELGAQRAGALVESALAGIASELLRLGVTQLIVAGGETSGAVVKALGVRGLRIGPEIDPGVPWTVSVDGERPLALALKSGNFGTPDFFLKAWSCLR